MSFFMISLRFLGLRNVIKILYLTRIKNRAGNSTQYPGHAGGTGRVRRLGNQMEPGPIF